MRTIIYCVLNLMLAASLWAADHPFSVGEVVEYDIMVEVHGAMELRGRAGRQTVTVKEMSTMRGRKVYHCIAEARSLRWVEPIYKLHDIFHVWFDAETFEPYRIEKFVTEGSWTNHILVDFHIPEGYAIYNDKRTKNKRYDVPVKNGYDIVTLLYYLRTVKEQRLPLKIFWIANTWFRPVSLAFASRKPIRVPPLSRFKKIPLLEAHEKDLYGIRVGMAEGHNRVPVYANIDQIEIYGYTILVKGRLRKYKAGKK